MGRIVQVFLGLFLFFFVLNIPVEMTSDIRKVVAIMSLVMVWWIFETLPLAITGLIGTSLVVVLGVTNVNQAFSGYANPLIYLFMGGFFIARAMELTGLHLRMAEVIFKFSIFKKSPFHFFSGILLMCVFLSMWLSNTAAVAILIPMVLAITNEMELTPSEQQLVLIFLAYAASIGGCATPVGSPPNLIAIGALKKFSDISVSFFEWTLFALPIWIVATIFLLMYLKKTLRISSDKFEISINQLAKNYANNKAMNSNEKWTGAILSVTIILWMLPGIASLLLPKDHGFSVWINQNLNESIVAILCSACLFIFPSPDRPILNWPLAAKIDWSTLLLFGAGISLGQVMFQSGLVDIIASSLTAHFKFMPLFLIFFILIAFAIILTTISSNTATANLLLPLVIALTSQLNLEPKYMALVIGLTCNLAFMLPVSTPPNAIVYGTGLVEGKAMFTYGFKFNLLMCFVLSLSLMFLYQ
jgi:solute carrier family 13 (sodium-dependent dicarboxylate transporter), member 2/3/5